MEDHLVTETIVINCPYCGESYETVVDPSAGSQRYVEDCAVCCKPIEVALRVSEDGELLDVSTATDRD
jgi:transposase-like protein